MSPFPSAGDCQFPIKPGIVFKLDTPRLHRSTGSLEYDVYIWVQKLGMLAKGQYERRRSFWVLTCLVPRIQALRDQVKIRRHRIQKESIAFQLKKGYSIVTHDLKYRQWAQAEDLETFYKELGLL